MLFDYKNAYDLKIKDILKIADDFSISGALEIIESMRELKHALLPKLAREHDVKEWGEEVIASTSKILTL